MGNAGPDGTGRNWYALRSKPRKEFWSSALLQLAGTEVYIPQVSVQKHPRKPQTFEPLFPGYLFSRLSPQLGEIRLAKYTPGILYVVSSGAEPSPVPNELIVSIQQRISQGWGRIVGTEYQCGDRVVINNGPLRDLEAIFDHKLSPNGRVRVLIRILNRLCGVEVHVAQLRRVSKAAG